MLRSTKMQFAGIFRTTQKISIRIVLTILIIAVDGLLTDYDWSSKHLNYLVIHNPPFDFVFRGSNGTFTSYGSGHNVATWLAAKLKYTFRKISDVALKFRSHCLCQLDIFFGFLKRTVRIPMFIANRKLVELWETGLTNFWVYNLFPPTAPRAEQCFVESTRRVSSRAPIQLSDLTSAFLILGIGTGLSVLSFLTELLYSRFRLYSECTLRILYESSIHLVIFENVQSSCLLNQLAPPTYTL
ncbi:Uncharacterized protein APZ42_023289 [Daphnia magna]|uniref:Uncharacterized protein n=1 Tax=Daphnia magna TaxID=35525 RepID=A0A164V3B1_9CRUS|nr:Uncharacterized protein APZ42_023289 [Daphnia magna]